MKSILAILVIATILLAGCSGQQNTDVRNTDTSISGDDIPEVRKPVLLAGNKAKYYEFTQEAYDGALNQNNIILLYFYANWCPICRAEQPETLAAFNELDNENVVGFRVNYKDSQTDEYEEALAKEFGITYQHTKVILKDGQRILKAPDTWDKDRYLEELKKVA